MPPAAIGEYRRKFHWNSTRQTVATLSSMNRTLPANPATVLLYARSTEFRQQLFAGRQEVSRPDCGRFSETVVRFVAIVVCSALVVPRLSHLCEVLSVTLKRPDSESKKFAGFETEPSPEMCRSASRSKNSPSHMFEVIGFRAALPVVPETMSRSDSGRA